MAGQEEFNKVVDSIKQSSALSGPERFFDSIGLMRAWWTPFGRAAFGAAVGYLLVQAIRPKSMFDPKTGKPRVWYYHGGDTYFPWWVVPAGFAIVCGVFI